MTLSANEHTAQVSESEKANEGELQLPRICSLIPELWFSVPYIEPAIPLDYVACSLNGKESFDKASRILWGEKEDIKLFAKDQDAKINKPVFVLRHGQDAVQTGPNSFNVESQVGLMKKQLNASVKTKKIMWGSYPVFAMEVKLKDGKITRSAFIGLNDNGHVLMVNLFSPKYPEGEKISQAIWDSFLSNTKSLKEQELFLASGLDMRDGYTNYNKYKSSLIFKAEKSNIDGKLAVQIIPKTPGASFQLEKVQEGLMGSKWKYLEPCAKIFGVITQKEENMTNVIEVVITVLTKNVDQYSFPILPALQPQNAVVHLQ